jgi:hypothetical protein
MIKQLAHLCLKTRQLRRMTASLGFRGADLGGGLADVLGMQLDFVHGAKL